ncbi:MAG: ABC transporter ATP-binding protein [Planctomycetes bacterium]|nr:ABC transporter ATP-binding protein [Planctomycetota bacterium]
MKKYEYDDEILGKAYDGRLMKRLMSYIKPYKYLAILALALTIITNICGLLEPLLIGYAIDMGIRQHSWHNLKDIARIYLGLVLLKILFSYLGAYLLAWLSTRTLYDLRMTLFAHLQKLSLPFYAKNPVGRLVTRVISDIQVLSDFFGIGIIAVVNDILMIAGLICFILWLNAQLALIILCVVPVITILTIFFKNRLRALYREIRRKIALINANLQENVSGIKVVQAFNREEQNLEHFKNINTDFFNSCMKSLIYHSIFWPLIALLSAIAISNIIYYGGGQVLTSDFEIGKFYTLLQYALMFFGPIQDLTDKYTLFQSSMASAERIFKLLDETPESEPQSPIRLTERLKGDIEFKNVWFAYNAENYVTEELSFNIKAGERVAIVGATGAGKSTIINLMCRFYDPTKGRILIDGTDISTMPRRELRRKLGIVLQDVFLFSGDIMNNIGLGEKTFTEAELIESAKYVNADKFIEQLPGQYHAEVQERGCTLSAGQRQLLSFARALAFDPEILILDEATASIDVETEAYIQDAIHKLIKGRTSIIIAHRLSTIQDVDRILVMHRGRLREEGSHEQLIAQKGIYYKLYQAQFASTQSL